MTVLGIASQFKLMSLRHITSTFSCSETIRTGFLLPNPRPLPIPHSHTPDKPIPCNPNMKPIRFPRPPAPDKPRRRTGLAGLVGLDAGAYTRPLFSST